LILISFLGCGHVPCVGCVVVISHWIYASTVKNIRISRR
jgi:hypothetical protein